MCSSDLLLRLDDRRCVFLRLFRRLVRVYHHFGHRGIDRLDREGRRVFRADELDLPEVGVEEGDESVKAGREGESVFFFFIGGMRRMGRGRRLGVGVGMGVRMSARGFCADESAQERVGEGINALLTEAGLPSTPRTRAMTESATMSFVTEPTHSIARSCLPAALISTVDMTCAHRASALPHR